MNRLFELLKRNSGRIQASISGILKIVIIFSILYSVYFHLWQVFFADCFLLLLLFVPVFLKDYNINIPKEFELVVFLFIIISFFLGSIRGLIIQVFFGIAIGFIGFAIMLILFSNSKIKINYFLIIIFSLSLTLSLGLFAEMAKYYLKYYLGYELSAYDYGYTMRSLTLVFIGAVISSSIGYLYMKGYKFAILKDVVKKFKSRNPNLFMKRTDSPEEIIILIKRGENEHLEFKSTLRTNLHTAEHDKKIENAALKTIVAFLNSHGGTLFIGVSDSGEVIGIEKDGFENNDKFNRHFTNLIKERIGNEFLPYMNFEIFLIEGKSVLKIDCLKSDKPVFLKDGVEEFYIRVGASSLNISGSKLIDYIKNKFNS